MKKIILLIALLFATVSSAGILNINGIQINVQKECIGGYQWRSFTNIMNQNVDLEQVFVRKYSGEAKPLYCPGHTRDHYDAYGRPNNAYMNYNQSHGLSISSMIVGAAVWSALSPSRQTGYVQHNKTIVNKTIINKTVVNKRNQKPVVKKQPIKKPTGSFKNLSKKKTSMSTSRSNQLKMKYRKTTKKRY